MYKQVLINVEATDLRVAMLEDGELVELFVDHFNSQSVLGNIYKGRVEGIVPGLKAVFVNIGHEKNAFLHFSDVLQEYDLPMKGRPQRQAPAASKRKAGPAKDEAGEDEDDYIEPQILPGEDEEEEEDARKRRSRSAKRSRPLQVGDSILVQVVKEPINEKGARITSYISTPGRYLVMMPFSDNAGGISRKIDNPEERRRLRDLLRGLKNTEGGSFIIRTAGLEEDEQAIVEDHDFLVKQWKTIRKKNLRANAPALIHNEQDILQRLVRDTLRNDIDEILIDSRSEMKNLIKACEMMAPAMIERIHLYQSSKNIFEVFEVEQQFQKALRRKVWMKNGGFLVIDETEALTAVDVNSGKYVGSEDQDQVILHTNLAACEMISRQLRLRDLGGLIVIDFIDMTNRDHQHQVLRQFKSCLRKDDAKYAMTGFSDFGLVEMTRKRVRMSLARAIYRQCPYCEGAGRILGEPQIWKRIKYAIIDELAKHPGTDSAQILVHSQIRSYLQKEVLDDIQRISGEYGIALEFVARPDFHHEQFEIVRPVKSSTNGNSGASRRKRRAVKDKS